MQTAATTPHAGQGWRHPLPAALDGPQTPLLVVGASQRPADALALQDGSLRAAVGLAGDRLVVGNGCEGGWMDVGPERRITCSNGNVLHALDLFKASRGALAQGERTGEDMESVLEAAPAGAGHTGCDSWGEIAPMAGGRAGDLRNPTLVVTVCSER